MPGTFPFYSAKEKGTVMDLKDFIQAAVSQIVEGTVAAQTGATAGTSRRVVYLLACSGVPTSATMEAQAREAAQITEKQRLTARQAAVAVLSGTATEGRASPLKDC